MKRLLVLFLLTITSFAIGEGMSESQYYQSIAASASAADPSAEGGQNENQVLQDEASTASGLTPSSQQQATQNMTAGQAAGLSFAGPEDVAAALGKYQPAEMAAQAAAPAGSTYVDPSRNDPPVNRENIEQNEQGDLAASPPQDPHLIQDTRNYSLQNITNNGRGAWIGAAQQMEIGLDKSHDTVTTQSTMEAPRTNGFGTVSLAPN